MKWFAIFLLRINLFDLVCSPSFASSAIYNRIGILGHVCFVGKWSSQPISIHWNIRPLFQLQPISTNVSRNFFSQTFFKKYFFHKIFLQFFILQIFSKNIFRNKNFQISKTNLIKINFDSNFLKNNFEKILRKNLKIW